MNEIETTVENESGKSEPIFMNAGVPQGGPASGPLFTIPIAHSIVEAHHIYLLNIRNM